MEDYRKYVQKRDFIDLIPYFLAVPVVAFFALSRLSFIGGKLPEKLVADAGLVAAILMMIVWAATDRRDLYRSIAAAKAKVAADEAERIRLAEEAEQAKYEYLTFDVHGVQYANTDGMHRQAILEQLSQQNRPFDVQDVELRKETYQGEDACGVYVGGWKIGYVPRLLADDLCGRFDHIDDIVDFKITKDDRPEKASALRSYGARMRVRLLTDDAYAAQHWDDQ